MIIREKITTKENKEKPWNLKFIEQVTAIDLSGLKCYLRDEWREEGKCIEIPFAEKRLNAQIQAIERAVNHRFELDKIYKRKKQQEIEEDEDSDDSDHDPHHDCPIYGSKKNYIEEKYLTEKNLIKALTVIFEQNAFWDIAFLAPSWLNQDYPHTILSLCPCGKINKKWLEDNNILSDVEFDGQPGLCKKYEFRDKVSYFNHICQKA